MTQIGQRTLLAMVAHVAMFTGKVSLSGSVSFVWAGSVEIKCDDPLIEGPSSQITDCQNIALL